MKNKILILMLIAALGLMAGCGRKAGLTGGAVQKAGMLSDFEDVKVWDISPETGFDLSLSKDNVTEGEHSLKVVYPIGGYPSINTKRLKHDWGNYEYFAFDVFNPQDTKVNFTIRLDDSNKARINIGNPLEPGLNHVQIPRTSIAKSINPGNISRIVLFLDDPQEKITLYFDNMRLINGASGYAGNSGPQPAVQKPTKPFIDTEIFEPMTIAAALPLKGTMKVSVAKLRDENKIDLLVSNGIPFAPGQLFNENNFSVLDFDGNEMPIAIKVLARWPHDNSIRSILVQFPMQIPHKYKQVILRWGEPRTTKDIGLIEVNWVLPEAIVLLPAKWLCLSKVIGEQVPIGAEPFQKYDQNIESAYPGIKEVQWTNDIGKDGYYDTPHVFYQLYVRSNNDEYFKSARKEAVHLRDEQIVQEGPDRGKAITGGKTRYVYVEGMIDDYLLTGDAKSLTIAGYMAEYLKNAYKPSTAFFPRNGTHFWTEREPAFPLIGTITYYELTGDKEYLKYAQEVIRNLYKTQAEWPERGGFIHNLYSHDPEEGARRDEYGGSPFMTGLLLEGIVKYHQLTNSNIAKDSIFRALDWLMNEAAAPSGDAFVYTTADANKDEGHPDLNMLIVHAFGYGYKISGYTRTDYLELGKKIFECGANNARLGDRKHFNQNYRSSGHYLSYITLMK
jgi:hypothetical protein